MREPIEEKELSPGIPPADGQAEPRSAEAEETSSNGRPPRPELVLLRGAAQTLPAPAGGNGHRPPAKDVPVAAAGEGGEGPPADQAPKSLLPDPKLLEAVERCLHGFDDEDDFRLIHDTYYGRLRGYFIKARGVPEEECFDLLSETFLTVWRKRTTIRDPTRISGFIFKVAQTTFLKWCRKKTSELRKHGYRRRYSSDDGTLPEHEISDDPWPLRSAKQEGGPDEDLLAKERDKRLCEVLRELPPKTGLVARLRFRDGLRNKEIAEKLRMTPNYVGVLLNDAKRRLKNILKDDD